MFLNISGSYRSVTGGAERFRHSLFGPCEDVAAGAHRSSDQHRLTRELITQQQTTGSDLQNQQHYTQPHDKSSEEREPGSLRG